jgi:hypothetical protein
MSISLFIVLNGWIPSLYLWSELNLEFFTFFAFFLVLSTVNIYGKFQGMDAIAIGKTAISLQISLVTVIIYLFSILILIANEQVTPYNILYSIICSTIVGIVYGFYNLNRYISRVYNLLPLAIYLIIVLLILYVFDLRSINYIYLILYSLIMLLLSGYSFYGIYKIKS